MPPALTLTDFSDPACPFAFSAEPARLRIDWLYGDAIEWRTAMVGLAESPEVQAAKGLTTEMLAKGAAQLAERYGMPIDSSEAPRLVATVPACKAVVAGRLHAPESEHALLRALRVRGFSGELIDEPETIAHAATDAGVDPEQLAAWCAEADVELALRDDMYRARHPKPPALVLDARLADWEEGRRYTCPSYEIVRADGTGDCTIPGFQPFAVYDVALANLAPEIERRALPETVEEVLEWAPYPLATAEIALLRDVSLEQAREELGAVATERHVGQDGFWSLGAQHAPATA